MLILAFLSGLLARGLAVPNPVIYTPVPVQSGMVKNCEGFAPANVGDSCQAVAARQNLPIADFLAYNPMLGAATTCDKKLVIGDFYCIKTMNGKASPATSTSKSSTKLGTRPGTTSPVPSGSPAGPPGSTASSKEPSPPSTASSKKPPPPSTESSKEPPPPSTASSKKPLPPTSTESSKEPSPQPTESSKKPPPTSTESSRDDPPPPTTSKTTRKTSSKKASKTITSTLYSTTTTRTSVVFVGAHGRAVPAASSAPPENHSPNASSDSPAKDSSPKSDTLKDPPQADPKPPPPDSTTTEKSPPDPSPPPPEKSSGPPPEPAKTDLPKDPPPPPAAPTTPSYQTYPTPTVMISDRSACTFAVLDPCYSAFRFQTNFNGFCKSYMAATATQTNAWDIQGVPEELAPFCGAPVQLSQMCYCQLNKGIASYGQAIDYSV